MLENNRVKAKTSGKVGRDDFRCFISRGAIEVVRMLTIKQLWTREPHATYYLLPTSLKATNGPSECTVAAVHGLLVHFD